MKAGRLRGIDRKSTRLNSSHSSISYAVFCLKKNEEKTFKPIGQRGRGCLRAERHGASRGVLALSHRGSPARLRPQVANFCSRHLFFLRTRRPPNLTLFPATALFA